MFGRYLATARTALRATTPLANGTAVAAPIVRRTVVPITSTPTSSTASTWRVRQLHTSMTQPLSSSSSSMRRATKLSTNDIINMTSTRRWLAKVAISPGEFQRLQSLERDADGHPSSEAMQVRFYKALLKPMPGIIVQRYESGNFASGAEADLLYEQALSRVEENVNNGGNINDHKSSSVNAHQPPPSSPFPHQPFGQPSSPYGYPSHAPPPPSYGMPSAYGNMPPSPYGYNAAGMPPMMPMYYAPPPPPPQAPAPTNEQKHDTHEDHRPELGSEARPLYMQPVPDKWARGFEAARLCMSIGFIYYLYTLLSPDEKGETGIPGLPGSAAGKAHREADISQTTTRFSDVKGCDEAKHELQEIVQFLRDPEKFTKLGAKLPRGVLLTGPPGTGKTLLAKAVAGEAGVPFFFASGSEFDEMYVGVGASRIKKLFAQARKKSPCIIFIDELDAIGGRRNPRDSTHSRQAINQLLVELDGFDVNDKVIIIGATNLQSVLDKALLRPGRFDRQVEVPLPDVKGRKEILELYGKKVPLAPDANLLQLARGTPGSSGAELFNLINSAALRAAQLNSKQVTTHHLEWARDKILMGPERKSQIMTEAERKCTAYHEGGHAIMALKTKGSHPIHKATIMRRGNVLGFVAQLPEQDENSKDREQMMAWIDTCMGGRVAEEMIFGDNHITSGASGDLESATRTARNMILRYGMGRTTGLTAITEEDLQSNIISEETRQAVDAEVKEMLAASYARAKNTLTTNEAALHRVAQALLKYETLDAKELTTIVNGGTIDGSRFDATELAELAQRAVERDQREKDRLAARAAEAAAAHGPSPPPPSPSSGPSGGTAIPVPQPAPKPNVGPLPAPAPSPAAAAAKPAAAKNT